MSSGRTQPYLQSVLALAYLLECVEAGVASASAEGYRRLVLGLQAALSEDIPADTLQAILNVFPAAAEVFENIHYAGSGLSRASLERSISSELLAKQVLKRAAGRRVPKTAWQTFAAPDWLSDTRTKSTAQFSFGGAGRVGRHGRGETGFKNAPPAQP